MVHFCCVTCRLGGRACTGRVRASYSCLKSPCPPWMCDHTHILYEGSCSYPCKVSLLSASLPCVVQGSGDVGVHCQVRWCEAQPVPWPWWHSGSWRWAHLPGHSEPGPWQCGGHVPHHRAGRDGAGRRAAFKCAACLFGACYVLEAMSSCWKHYESPHVTELPWHTLPVACSHLCCLTALAC